MTTAAGPEVEQVTSKPEKPEGERETSLARRKKVEQTLKRAEHTMQRIGRALERPLVGAIVAGGLVAAAAGMWGPTEAALGAAVALVMYRMLTRRRHEQPAYAGEQRAQTGEQPAHGFAG